MTSIDDIDAAFGAVEKPEHFCKLHCEECEEHDRLLRQRDRTTITIEDVGNPGWDPISFISPEGMAYFMPALARLALSNPTREYSWYGDQLIFHLKHGGASNPFLNFCNPMQRNAIGNFLIEMQRFGRSIENRLSVPEGVVQAFDLWRA